MWPPHAHRSRSWNRSLIGYLDWLYKDKVWNWSACSANQQTFDFIELQIFTFRFILFDETSPIRTRVAKGFQPATHSNVLDRWRQLLIGSGSSRPGSGRGYRPGRRQYFYTRRLSDDGDAFEGLAHISQHVILPSKGQSPAAAVGLGYITALPRHWSSNFFRFVKKNKTCSFYIFLLNLSPFDDLLAVNTATAVTVDFEQIHFSFLLGEGGSFGFCDLALIIRLPAIKVVFLAAGGEKRTLCSNHRLFLSLQPLLFSLLIWPTHLIASCVPVNLAQLSPPGCCRRDHFFFLLYRVVNRCWNLLFSLRWKNKLQIPCRYTEGEIVSLWMWKLQWKNTSKTLVARNVRLTSGSGGEENGGQDWESSNPAKPQSAVEWRREAGAAARAETRDLGSFFWLAAAEPLPRHRHHATRCRRSGGRRNARQEGSLGGRGRERRGKVDRRHLGVFKKKERAEWLSHVGRRDRRDWSRAAGVNKSSRRFRNQKKEKKIKNQLSVAAGVLVKTGCKTVNHRKSQPSERRQHLNVKELKVEEHLCYLFPSDCASLVLVQSLEVQTFSSERRRPQREK